jgi:hypothetical protein
MKYLAQFQDADVCMGSPDEVPVALYGAIIGALVFGLFYR